MERTNIITYVLTSENRKKIVTTLFEYPKRQWSCPMLEEYTKLSHATVFRTIKRLKEFGIIKSTKINRRDLTYELVEENLLVEELKRAINMEQAIARRIAENFAGSIKSKDVFSVILYGSSVKGNISPESDIDILIVLNKESEEKNKNIYNKAAEMSSRINKTIAVTIMNRKELKKEKDTAFIKSFKGAKEIIYGKNPF